MSRPRIRWTLAALIAALAGAACGAAGGRTEPPAAPAPAAGPGAEMEATFWARIDSARARFTEADAHFVTAMIPHHAQAIAMAKLADARAASPSVRTLARRILSAQQDEIVLMQQWLGERGLPVPEVRVSDDAVTVHGADHALHAPGMLTPEQLRRLELAEGAAFDRLFLTFMIEHHRGALTMVRELFSTDGAGQDPALFRFAADVQVDQATEIARMERMLAELLPGDRFR